MVDISNRIEGVITFTLIRYVFNVLHRRTDIQTILMYSVWLLQFIFAVSTLKIKDSALKEILQIFKKLSILLINQSIIFSATLQKSDLIEQNIIIFVYLTAILSFAFIISEVLQIPTYTDRGLTLLLYMYTDASNEILKSLNLEYAAVSVCFGVYITLHVINLKSNLTKLQLFFLRALNMIAVNLVLSALLTNLDSTNIHTTSMLSILFLYLLSSLEKIWPQISESKDYALWRTAQNLYELYSKYEHDFLLSMFLILIYIAAKFVLHKQKLKRLTTLMDIIALFLVNVLLGLVSEVIMSTKSTYQVIVMFIYVILIHYGTSCILMIV